MMSLEQMYASKDIISLSVIFARRLAHLHNCQVQNTRNHPYSYISPVGGLLFAAVLLGQKCKHSYVSG